MLRGQRKKDLAPGSEQAGEIERGQRPQEAPGIGSQVGLRPWLALAKGTPGSWPTGEGAGLVRGSPQTSPLGPRVKQIQVLRVRSAPKRSLDGKNYCLITSYGSPRESNTLCAVAVVWVLKRVLPRQLFLSPVRPTEA